MEHATGIKWTKTCYGVDLQAGGIRAVRAVRSGNRVNCRAVAPGEISRMLDDIRGGTPAAACVSAGKSFVRWLEAPFASSRKAGKVFPTLLDMELPFPLEECVYSFISGELTEKNTTRALAVAARMSDVRNFIELYSRHGADPAVLDQEGLALWHQCLRENPFAVNETGLRAVVWLGTDHWTVSLGNAKGLISSNVIRAGDAPNIRRILASVADKNAPGINWFWTGPGADTAQNTDKIRAAVGINAPGSSVILPEPEHFLAKAAASRALLQEPSSLNLRSGPLTHPGIMEASKRRAFTDVILLLAAGVILCAVNIFIMAYLDRTEKLLDTRFSSMANELAGYQVTARGEHAVKIVTEKVNQRLAASAPVISSFDPSLTALVASLVKAGKKNSIQFEVISVDRDKIMISAAGTGWKSGEGILDLVKKSGYPTASLERKEALDDGRIPFSIISGAVK